MLQQCSCMHACPILPRHIPENPGQGKGLCHYHFPNTKYPRIPGISPLHVYIYSPIPQYKVSWDTRDIPRISPLYTLPNPLIHSILRYQGHTQDIPPIYTP